MNTLKNWQIALAALIVWVLRVAVIMPFLGENGGFDLSNVDGGAGLPPIVDYFFSALFFAMIAMMGIISYWFIPKAGGNYQKAGLRIMVIFFVVFFVIDIFVEIVGFQRTFIGYLQAVFIDYSPLLLPWIVGATVQKTLGK